MVWLKHLILAGLIFPNLAVAEAASSLSSTSYPECEFLLSSLLAKVAHGSLTAAHQEIRDLNIEVAPHVTHLFSLTAEAIRADTSRNGFRDEMMYSWIHGALSRAKRSEGKTLQLSHVNQAFDYYFLSDGFREVSHSHVDRWRSIFKSVQTRSILPRLEHDFQVIQRLGPIQTEYPLSWLLDENLFHWHYNLDEDDEILKRVELRGYNRSSYRELVSTLRDIEMFRQHQRSLQSRTR